MNVKIVKNGGNLGIQWKQNSDEEFFLLSLHIFKDAEPFAMIIYPDMIFKKNGLNFVQVPYPPFSHGVLRLSSFSQKFPNIYGNPIRMEEVSI